jgi:hypothetical protein
MIYKDLPCIIKNSQNVIYKFWLDSSNNLNVESYNELNPRTNTKFIYKSSVLDYSIDIDDIDRIHIIFVTKDGVLNYSMLDSPDLEKTISSIPSKDYKIDYLTIKYISSEIHIFYMVQNKYNIDKGSINHSFFHNNTWILKKFDEALLAKNSLPYSVESYKNNLYILYSTIIPNQYCIQKFNISFSIWTTIEKDILLTNCQNVELFINSLGIGVICYNLYVNRSINTLIKFKDFNVSSSVWSDSLLVKNNALNFSLPSILCNNDALFLFWQENTTLFLRKFFYETTSLGEKKLIPYKDIVFSYKYITNKNPYRTIKNNFLFFTDTTPPHTILEQNSIKDFLKTDSKKLEQKFNPLNGPLKETLKIIAENSNNNSKEKFDKKNENIDTLKLDKYNYNANNLKIPINLIYAEIDQLNNSLSLKDNELENFKNTLDLKESEIEQLRNNLRLKESEIQQLKNNFNSEENEIEQFKNSLNLKNTEVEQLKNSLILTSSEIQRLNASFSSTKTLIAEKDLLIQNLYTKIEQLELQLQSEKENIETSQIQKKKSFLNLFKI